MTDREIHKIHIAQEIRTLFLTKWAGKWISEKEMRGKNRLWQQVFSELVQQGFIEKKKGMPFDLFKWKEPLE